MPDTYIGTTFEGLEEMSPAAIRSQRLQELLRMALAGKTLEEITARANQMASPTVAKGYVQEVLRRVQKR